VAGAEWRVGRTLGRTLYVGDAVVGMVDTPEIAARICLAMNRGPEEEHAGLCARLASHANEIARLRAALESIGGAEAAAVLAGPPDHDGLDRWGRERV
jgi:hypothetical protein